MNERDRLRERIANIRKSAHPINDYALLEFVTLYEQIVGQLDQVAQVVDARQVVPAGADTHDLTVVGTDDNKNPVVYFYYGERMREEIRKVLGL